MGAGVVSGLGGAGGASGAAGIIVGGVLSASAQLSAGRAGCGPGILYVSYNFGKGTSF